MTHVDPALDPSVLADRARAIAETLAVDAATAEVSSALNARGVRAIVLKGPTFARWLYSSGERSYSDTDLIVPPRDFDRAERELARLGFRRWAPSDDPLDRPSHAHTWIRHADERVVDLHRTLIGIGADRERLWSALADHCEEIEVSGSYVRALDTDARTMVLTLHAAQDGVRQGKPLEDLRRALKVVDGRGWIAAWQLAQELDAMEAFGAGLRMTEEGRSVAALLHVPEPSAVDVKLRARGAPPLSLGIDWLLSIRGLRDRSLFIWRKLFPPLDYIKSWSPLATRGRFGVIAAYVLRIWWMISRLPGAYRAWRRAVKE